MVSDQIGGRPAAGSGRISSLHNGLILIEQYKNIFRALQEADLSRLQFIYAEDIVYRDSVREIRGLVLLEDHFASLCRDSIDFRFEFVDQLIGDRSAYLKWNLHHRACSSERAPTSLRGVTHLRTGEKIEYQENFYDLDHSDQKHPHWLGAINRWFGKQPVRKSMRVRS